MALTPIAFETHGKTRIRPLANYAFAAKQLLIPVAASEIVAFCQEIPVIFAPQGEEFTLAALTGLGSDRNLLIDETGRWHGAHVPAAWRRGPFRLAAVSGDQEGRLALCLEDGNAQISETEGMPLFDEEGKPTTLLTEASQLLSKFEANSRHTRTICTLLQSLGLLVPWAIDIPKADGGKTQLKGLFRIDEAKIGTLSGDDLVALRNCGGLAVIYAHLLSLSKAGVLARISQQLTQREAVKSNKVDLDRAFGIVEDDPFIF